MTQLRTVLAAAMLLLCTTHPSSAADRVDDLLSRPVSPGSLALLLPNSRDARVTARWIESLAHSDARIRLMAARLLRQSRPPTAVDALKKALSAENDHFVAAEEARTLLETGSDSDSTVIEAAARLKDNGLAAILGRVRGARALSQFDRVKQQCGSPAAAALIAAIAEMTPAALNTLPEPVVEDDAALEAALNAAIMLRTAPQADWLPNVLVNRNDVLRTLAWWSIAVAVDAESIAEIVRNVSATPTRADDSSALRLGHMFALRAVGQKVEGDAVQLMTQAAADERLPASVITAIRDGAVTRLLSESEQENTPQTLRVFLPPQAQTSNSGSPVPYSEMRIVDGLPRGLITDVMTVSGCKPKPRDAFAGTLVKYGSTGQPSQLALLESDLPQACRDAVQALVITSLLGQDGASTPDSSHAVLVPLDSEFDQCLDPLSDTTDGRLQTVAPLRVRGPITPPAKTKDVRPIYPKDAQARHVTGIVIIDATVSTEGCVSRAVVIRNVDPLLDVEALRAVSQWKFAPTLVDSVPHPVLMTVTVQFTLQ